MCRLRDVRVLHCTSCGGDDGAVRQINSIMLGFHSGIAEESRLTSTKSVRTDCPTDQPTD